MQQHAVAWPLQRVDRREVTGLPRAFLGAKAFSNQHATLDETSVATIPSPDSLEYAIQRLVMFLQVPWSQLGTQPVVAEFDRLYVVASPREDDSGKGSCPQNVGDAIAAAQAAEQKAKRHRIDTAEDTWLKVGVLMQLVI